MRNHSINTKMWAKTLFLLLFPLLIVFLQQLHLLFYVNEDIHHLNSEDFHRLVAENIANEIHEEAQIFSPVINDQSEPLKNTDTGQHNLMNIQHKDKDNVRIESEVQSTEHNISQEQEHYQKKPEQIEPSTTYMSLIETVTNETCIEEKRNFDWMKLCTAKIVDTAFTLLQKDQDIIIVQVGAHIGFESGDPIAKGMKQFIASSTNHLVSVSKERFHWFFVEPSPTNYAKLTENINKEQGLCKMHSIHAAVISQEQKGQDMTFYSMSDAIDPETGYDSKTKRRLPPWITQISSFQKESILKNKGLFDKKGLDVEDFIVETKVPLKTIDNLMEEVNDILGNGDSIAEPLILMIDAEGNDCDIVLGMPLSSKKLPHYILFERNCHDDDKGDRAIKHLTSVGF